MDKKSITILKICLSVLICVTFLLDFWFKQSEKEQEKHIIEEEQNYALKISYPVLQNKKLDKIMNTMIENEKEEFLNKVKGKPKVDENTLYDFIVTYYENDWMDLKIIHFVIQSYIGGDNYERKDVTYYWDNKTESLIQATDLLEENRLDKLAELAYYSLKEKSENENLNLDDAVIKQGVAANVENYKHLNITGQGLEILFPPSQVGPKILGEIKILIPFNNLLSILKNEYIDEKTKENALISSQSKRNLDQFRGKKLLALTFDDGPGAGTTEKLLDGLKERNIKVTFFTLGSRVAQFPAIVKRAYEEGHEIASHTYNHKNLFHLSDYEVFKEVKDTNDIILNTIGITPSYLRPPYGNINDHIKQISNIPTILWSLDTLDWKLRNKDLICNNIIEKAKDGDIILLHDIYYATVDGVLMAIDALKDEYAFVTITEMIELRGISLEPLRTYYHF